jgi:hypothetical protein
MHDDDRSRDLSHRRGHDISALSAHCDEIPGIAKDDLVPGDRLVVTTANSTYSLSALGGHYFAVSGGWFAPFGELVLRLNGCTFGGHAILDRMAAAPGLHLEFGNGVTSSRILRARVVPGGAVSLLN